MVLALVPFLILPALLGAEPEAGFTLELDEKGMRVESRPLAGSPFREYRLTTSTPKGVDILCESAFGDGRFDGREEYLLVRKVVSEGENERVIYEQRYAPLVSNRDFVTRAKRTLEPGKRCRIDFHLVHDQGPPIPKGYVRMKRLAGFWSIEPKADGQTQVVYVVHTDLNGMIPGFLAATGMRDSAAKWVRLVIERAGEKKAVGQGTTAERAKPISD